MHAQIINGTAQYNFPCSMCCRAEILIVQQVKSYMLYCTVRLLQRYRAATAVTRLSTACMGVSLDCTSGILFMNQSSWLDAASAVVIYGEISSKIFDRIWNFLLLNLFWRSHNEFFKVWEQNRAVVHPSNLRSPVTYDVSIRGALKPDTCSSRNR